MHAILSLHIGQSGVQIGNACWELFCLEHLIRPNGQFDQDAAHSPSSTGCDARFSETNQGKHVPRAVYADLEPTVVDEVRTATYRELFPPEQLIMWKEDAASNYAHGRYTAGKQIVDATINTIRKLAEKCWSVHGLLFCCPTQSVPDSVHISTAVVASQNSVLAMIATMFDFDCSIGCDNEALLICVAILVILSVRHTLIAQVTSSLTASLRFDGALRADFADRQKTWFHIHIFIH
jgi:tubulin alpha